MGGEAIDAMEAAMIAARKAGADGEVPVGAAVVDASGAVISVAANEVEALCDPSAHAEILAMRAAAAARGGKHLTDCDLYVTLEPCAMCAAAIALFRIRRLYFAAWDPKGGGVDHGARVFERPTTHHRPEVYGGLREAEAAAMLSDFFAARR
jgi:tRNA(Arg) A34 adenosine deaminase TadA